VEAGAFVPLILRFRILDERPNASGDARGLPDAPTTSTTLPPYVFACSVSMSGLFNPLHKVGDTEDASILLLGDPSVVRSFDLDVTVDYKQWSPTQRLTTKIDTLFKNASVTFTLQYSGGNPVTVSVAEHGKPTACETSFLPLIEPH
jgi:hypothetical protein